MSTKVIPHASEHWTSEQWELFNASEYGTVFQNATNYTDPDLYLSFGFDGDYDCNDGDGNCAWDGMSRRCDCGNRRVEWCFDGNFVYPSAW